MKVQVGRTYLTVPHGNGEITFQHPLFRGTYGDVANQVGKEGLKRPISSETSSLVCDAFQNPNGEYESQILNVLKSNWLWEFTGNLYLPKSSEEVSDGVLLEDYPQIINGRLTINKVSLIKRLQANDKSVRFVPFGYKIGEQTSKELGENLYIVARYGEEGAEKIARIASKFKDKPRVLSFESIDKETAKMSVLYGDFFNGRLCVDSGYWDGDDVGHSFGVVSSEKSE